MFFAQLILILIFAFFLLKTVLKWKQKELFFSETAGWMLLWILGLILAIKPDTASYFAKMLGIGRGVDLAVYLALITLFYMQFRMMVRLEKNNREITKLTREKALGEKKEKI